MAVNTTCLHTAVQAAGLPHGISGSLVGAGYNHLARVT